MDGSADRFFCLCLSVLLLCLRARCGNVTRFGLRGVSLQYEAEAHLRFQHACLVFVPTKAASGVGEATMHAPLRSPSRYCTDYFVQFQVSDGGLASGFWFPVSVSSFERSKPCRSRLRSTRHASSAECSGHPVVWMAGVCFSVGVTLWTCLLTNDDNSHRLQVRHQPRPMLVGLREGWIHLRMRGNARLLGMFCSSPPFHWHLWVVERKSDCSGLGYCVLTR